jgi:hypothetical protein
MLLIGLHRRAARDMALTLRQRFDANKAERNVRRAAELLAAGQARDRQAPPRPPLPCGSLNPGALPVVGGAGEAEASQPLYS